ncbi:MAG TPA: UBP-type zinc finger domain-containing protein [Anaerolineales bacterium]
MKKTCEHAAQLHEVTPTSDGCEECLKMGEEWVHLRLCETCGHVGCCDNSKNKHATKHAHETAHPIIKSFEPGEDWGYCYPDDVYFEELPVNKGSHHPIPNFMPHKR